MFRFRTALASAAVVVAAALAFAAPAAAHDELVSSSPAADEQLSTAPEEVVLTFSNNLLSLEENSGTAMTVIDEAGADWVAGEPVVAGDTVTVPLKPGMTDGMYQVTWKVVSSDGHPTDGEYAFSLAGVGAGQPSDEPTTEPTASAEPSTSAEPSDASSEPVDSEAASAPWPLLIGLGVVLLVAIVIVVVIAARKKRA